MDFNSILNRFNGSTFVLYGGNNDILKQVQDKGNVLYWYTDVRDEKSIPVKQLYTLFMDNVRDALSNISTTSEMRNAIFVIVGNGFVSGSKAEIVASRILRYIGYTRKIIIFHQYPDFVTLSNEGDVIGGMVKEVYSNGSIVVPEDDRVTYLRELTNIFNKDINIPVPLRLADLEVSSPLVQELRTVLPYIHLVSRIRNIKLQEGNIRIPATNDLPTDVLNLSDTVRQKEYDPNEWTSAVHWGQRKLLISEIELLVEVLREDIRRGGSGKGFLLVYVGAAPGSHIGYLLNLFANITDIKMHLWDRPSRFDVKDNGDTIRIVPKEFEDPDMKGEYEGFFTDVVAGKYVSQYGTDNKIIFISDIRDRAGEEAVDRDMKMQRRWVEILQPYASQLKFRLPFFEQGTYEYLSGRLYTQAWSRVKSTESRLLSFRPYSTTQYPIGTYDRIYSYFNTVTRMSSYNIGSVIDRTIREYRPNAPSSGIGSYILIPIDGYCTCHDCAREAQVIAKYMAYVNYPVNENNVVSFIKANTTNSRPHNDPGNFRTLWSKVSPKAPPSDRRNVVVYKVLPSNHSDFEKQLNTLWQQRIVELNVKEIENNDIVIVDTPIDRLRVMYASKILIYGDGLTPEEIIQMLISKQQGKTLISPSTRPILMLRNIIRGDTIRIVINFHTDFLKDYNPSNDNGTYGTSIYNRYKQSLAIKNQKKETSNIDAFGLLVLYALSVI